MWSEVFENGCIAVHCGVRWRPNVSGVLVPCECLLFAHSRPSWRGVMHNRIVIILRCKNPVLLEKGPYGHQLSGTRFVTLKPQSDGPIYSNTVIGILTVDWWAVTFGTARRGLGRRAVAPTSPVLAVRNVTASPPVNGQCTNFILINVALTFALSRGLKTQPRMV